MNKIKIAIADDHILVRNGLAKELLSDPQLEVVIEAEHGLDMLQQLARITEIPDIAIVDLSMPVMDGFTLTDELREKYPTIKVLILSGYNSEYNIAALIYKGVKGYLLKDCSPDEFRQAVHEIYENGVYYSDQATAQAFKAMLHHPNPKAIMIPDREMEFLKLCCTNLRYDQIAEKMGVTINTVEGYSERLFGRLNIKNRVALVLFAMQSGIVAHVTSNSNNLKSKS